MLNISFVESLKYVINQFRKKFKGSEKTGHQKQSSSGKKMNSETDFIENELEA